MRIMITLLTLAGLSAAACLAADANAGHAAYDKSCKSCHGADGTANPAIAKMMKVEMKNLASAEVQALSAGDLKKIVSEGKGKMKAVKTISGADLDNVIAFIHTLKK